MWILRQPRQCKWGSTPNNKATCLKNSQFELCVHLAQVDPRPDRAPGISQLHDGILELLNVLLSVFDNFKLLRCQLHRISVGRRYFGDADLRRGNTGQKHTAAAVHVQCGVATAAATGSRVSYKTAHCHCDTAEEFAGTSSRSRRSANSMASDIAGSYPKSAWVIDPETFRLTHRSIHSTFRGKLLAANARG